ncbi:unnamed protein product [Paramecium pentaurelia]|uniref:Insulin-like growth factor binding protein, N-terminal n=1 Tax=Paramecium pentaurelia TaxID=43138 RepID=A0A8S1UZM5_9CILI|nr:unnamed protein product [Paramecium pentaurelia]
MLWIIFLFNITFEQSLFYSAYTDSTLSIQDSNNTFKLDWQFFGNTTTNIISTCGSSSIIGGYNLFSNGVAATLFIDLQPHYKMKISFSLFIIDTWDNEYFYLYADQDLVFTQKYSNNNGQDEICGQPGSNRKDQIHQIEIEFDHTGLTSFIQLTSNLNDSAHDESWGFRNFRIYIYECPPQCYVCSKVDQQLQCEKWIRAYSIFTQLLENEFQENTLISVINGATTKQLCSQIPMMCGYGVCGRDTIIQMNNLQLPFHTRIKIKLKYLIIDSWESTDYAQILVDGVLRWTSELSLTNQNLYRVCGGGSNDIFVNLELTFPHIQTSTTIQILNTLNQDFSDESFGIRDLTIYTQQSNCGDQIIQENEECDDGNLVPFDGCFSCLYSCVDGCEICEKGNCLRCGQGWILQRQIQKCQRIDIPIIQFKLKEDKCNDKQNDIQMNQIRRDCETMDYSSLVVCEEDILNKCQPQCKICIQSVCYQCQVGQNLIMGQCYELLKNSIQLEDLSKQEFICDFNCEDCRNGICYQCYEKFQILDNQCVGICGDQIIQLNEECDDGNNVEFDGCFCCRYSCPQDCSFCQNGICIDKCQQGYYFIDNSCQTICGDSIIVGFEQCEDENNIQYDGCYQCRYSCPLFCNDCLNGYCYNCDQGFILSSNICIGVCGDGLLSIQEQCDDGNQIDGDGCSKKCQLETNWICNKNGDCAYVEYPIPIIEYYKQENQFQYVKMTFSQLVQQNLNLQYKDTIQLRILDLNQNLFNIIILETQPAQFQILQRVEYIFQIEIMSNQQNHPILEVLLTEQLYNENLAPLLYLLDNFQLNQPNHISEEEIITSKTFQNINEYSVNSLFAIQGILFLLLGNFFSFWVILDALQQQSYLKYINVQYPQTLIIYFESSDAVSMQSILNKLPRFKYNSTLLKFPFQKSYGKFEYYNINANIMEGLILEVLIFGSLLIGYLSTLFTINILKYLEINLFLQQWPKFILFIQKLKRKLHSKLKLFDDNSIKRTLLACSWDLIFIAFLELQVQHDFESSRAYIRLTIALVILMIIILVILQQIHGLRSWQKQNFIQFWEQQKEMFNLIKKILSLYIIIYNQQNQILQTLVLTLINTFYLFFIIYCQSKNGFQEYIKNIITEISLIIFTASTSLNWNIVSSYFSYQQRITISWVQMSVLVSVLVIFLFIEIYNLISIIIQTVNKIISFNRNQSNQSKLNELQNLNQVKVNPIKKQSNLNKVQNQQQPVINQRMFIVCQ